MEAYPGSELSVPQLLGALEEKLKHLIKAATSTEAFCLEEEEVDKMSARTRAIWMSMRYLQNSFAPVNRLPPEVLGIIPTSFRSKRDLIAATAVCRHWRNTLTASPNLWCDVNCSGNLGPLREHMFQECLRRSRSVPINVRLTSVRYLRDITPHLPRFVSLDVRLTVPEQLDKIVDHFSQPAPLLRNLSISATPPWDRTTLSIPPTFFGGRLEELRTLRLTGFATLKIPYHFPQLTRLDLQIRGSPNFKVDRMRTMLERMPLLEVLHIKFRPSQHPPASFRSTSRFLTLPKLKEVELSSSDNLCVMPPCIPPLLFALTLPSVERIAIGMLPPLGSIALPKSFEEQLPNFATTATVDIYVGLGVFKVSFHGRQGSRLLLFTNYCGELPQFEREGFRGIPFSTVKKLVVTVDRFSPGMREDFFELVRAMERLEYLELRGQCACQVLSLWSEKSRLDQQTICPSLRSIVVVRGPGDPVPDTPLLELENARKSHGVPLAEGAQVVDDCSTQIAIV